MRESEEIPTNWRDAFLLPLASLEQASGVARTVGREGGTWDGAKARIIKGAFRAGKRGREMREATARTMSVIVGVGMVAGGIAAVGEPIAQASAATDTCEATDRADDAIAESTTVRMADAVGVFAFNQDAVTSNRDIATTFRSAATALCTSLPSYAVRGMAEAASVSGPAGAYGVIVGDATAADGDTVTIGCVCASNGAGGGAAINARVSGTSLRSLAASMA